MAERVHYLVINLRGAGLDPRLVRERHSSLAAAKSQAVHDHGGGYRAVVRIEDAKGNTVWEP